MPAPGAFPQHHAREAISLPFSARGVAQRPMTHHRFSSCGPADVMGVTMTLSSRHWC
jgi:hypothetical protein